METFMRKFLYLVGSLLVAWITLKFFGLAKRFFWVLSEVFVLCNVALGAARAHSMKKHLRLHAYLCDPQYMDEVSVNEVYNFLMDSLDSSIPSQVQALHRLLLTYTHIMLCREKVDGSLRGMMLMGIIHKEKYTVMKLGLAVFKNYYRGGIWLYLIPAYLCLKELILHPRTPMYIVSKSFGYKSYLVATKFQEFYPRYNKETPEFYKNLFREFAESVKLPQEVYNPETFVLEREVSHLKDYIAVITEQDLKNPHIRFFNERNPGWSKGHCMCLGYRMSWRDWFNAILIALRKSKTSDSTARPQPAMSPGKQRRHHSRPKLLRRFTFQEPTANGYAVRLYEMDCHGDVVEKGNPYRLPSATDIPSPTSPTELDIDLPHDII